MNDKKALKRFEGDINELYGNMSKNHPILADNELKLSREALAYITKRLAESPKIIPVK